MSEAIAPIGTLLLTVPETCRVLSLGKTTVWELIAAGRLEVVRINRRTLVRTVSVRRIAGEA